MFQNQFYFLWLLLLEQVLCICELWSLPIIWPIYLAHLCCRLFAFFKPEIVKSILSVDYGLLSLQLLSLMNLPPCFHGIPLCAEQYITFIS